MTEHRRIFALVTSFFSWFQLSCCLRLWSWRRPRHWHQALSSELGFCSAYSALCRTLTIGEPRKAEQTRDYRFMKPLHILIRLRGKSTYLGTSCLPLFDTTPTLVNTSDGIRNTSVGNVELLQPEIPEEIRVKRSICGKSGAWKKIAYEWFVVRCGSMDSTKTGKARYC